MTLYYVSCWVEAIPCRTIHGNIVLKFIKKKKSFLGFNVLDLMLVMGRLILITFNLETC